jgi:predicted nucleic acid-binding protein
MIFADLVNGDSVFLDANTLIYHFTFHARYGASATDLVKRIERQELTGFTSTHILTEVAHRMMTIEALASAGRSLVSPTACAATPTKYDN